jgi:hypothetical protein
MGKGDKRRPSQITREEQDLRWKLYCGTISSAEFNRQYSKLKKDGLITRSGKVVK